MSSLAGSAAALRRELCLRNATYAERLQLAAATSSGGVVLYAPEAAAPARHGNFLDASYRAILKRPEWAQRLEKTHTSARRILPRNGRAWRELDSCASSDALLMNIFCYPGLCARPSVTALLGSHRSDRPSFGYRARVPLRGGASDRTEVDMRLGHLLVEAKLTETGFQTQRRALAETYADFLEVFDADPLRVSGSGRSGGRCMAWQLVRNALAAYALGTSFCLLVDARRPDLIEAWHQVMRAIRPGHVEFKTRCRALTWQELAAALPPKLQIFLAVKYGIQQRSISG